MWLRFSQFNWQFNFNFAGQIQERAEVQDELLLQRIGWQAVLWHVNITIIFIAITFWSNHFDGRIWRKSNSVRKMNKDGGRRNSDSCLNKKDEWGKCFCFSILTLFLVWLSLPRPRKGGGRSRALMIQTLARTLVSCSVFAKYLLRVAAFSFHI